VSALAALRDNRAVSPLTDALHDRDRSVRATAATGLGRLTDPGSGATAALVSALRDLSPGVRRAAAGALGSIKDTTTVPALTDLFRDDDRTVRRAAIRALASIRNSTALDALRSYSDTTDVEATRLIDSALRRRRVSL